MHTHTNHKICPEKILEMKIAVEATEDPNLNTSYVMEGGRKKKDKANGR